jgi:hypothetical protein
LTIQVWQSNRGKVYSVAVQDVMNETFARHREKKNQLQDGRSNAAATKTYVRLLDVGKALGDA